jgi:hypothetical protein
MMGAVTHQLLCCWSILQWHRINYANNSRTVLTRSSISLTISSKPEIAPSSCRASSHSCPVYKGLCQRDNSVS